MTKCDFSGWATRHDMLCGDGLTIRKNAFKDNDGDTVPLIWNHDHTSPDAVLGHAVLENRDDGVYAYCTFNDTKAGTNAKSLVHNGDVRSLSIYANKLMKTGNDVIHGSIRELSLVLAGQNPGAFIDFVMEHSEEDGESFIANYDENALVVYHSATKDDSDKEKETMAEEAKKTENEEVKKEEKESDKTVGEVLDTLNEEQKTAVYAVIADAIGDNDDEEEEEVKHNVFENDKQNEANVLSHSDLQNIITMAKASNVGTLQTALNIFAEENDTLAHAATAGGTMYGEGVIEQLFPDYKDVKPGAPELLERDLTWVGHVMSKTHKSPISRIRTRQADARIEALRAHGYKQKGDEKKVAGNIKLLSRTTDPQTIYRKDVMHRDDILDITDFDVVAYQWNIMRHNLEEEIARAILIGDGREDGDEMKIDETHVRSIWNDDDLYTIHADVDIEGMKSKLQGTNTGANFGDEYIYAEAIISAALYSREQYKGSGSLEFYCTPHLLNVMLLARDLNGRRIYSSKADLAAALNVSAIHTVEQFEGKTRTTKDGDTKKLLGLFVNLADYQIGATKGGEITKFDQFDIDFNQYKYLIETRISGALTKVYSAIALEEPVAAG